MCDSFSNSKHLNQAQKKEPARGSSDSTCRGVQVAQAEQPQAGGGKSKWHHVEH